MIGEVYKYLGGDSFLDGHLIEGGFYTVESFGEVEREVKLKTLLD